MPILGVKNAEIYNFCFAPNAHLLQRRLKNVVLPQKCTNNQNLHTFGAKPPHADYQYSSL